MTDKNIASPIKMASAKQDTVVSRRNFLVGGAASTGLAAASLVGASSAAASECKDDDLNVVVPKEVPESRNGKLTPGDFNAKGGITGAEVFAHACKQENLAALFCCPGNYSIINAIAAEGISVYGGRTEGAMAAAADAFSRVTGEVTACSGTEGPGFTQMLMEVSSAHACRTPLLVLASNMLLSMEDSYNSIQFQLQQPMTEGIKKWGKRILVPNRVHEYAAYAFRNLKSGVPAPVHLDFPGEVANAKYTDPSELTNYYGKEKYRSESIPHPSDKEIDAVVSMIKRADRPMIVAGQGVFYKKAWEALKTVAEKNDIAVVETGPSRGHFPDSHPLSAGTANDALGSVDLVIFVGQYLMPTMSDFSFGPDARAIRIHPEAEDLGRNWPLDLGIVSDEKVFLELLADALPKRTRSTWTAELAAAREAFEKTNEQYVKLAAKYSRDTGVIHPGMIGKELADFMYHGDIPREQTVFTVGSYTGSMWMRRFMRTHRPGQLINGPYQYYAIGPDFGYTIGAGAAVQQGVGPQAAYKGAPVITFTGDAGAGYSIMEMETLMKYRIPAIVVVYNNNSWGIWGLADKTPRAKHLYLFQENVRYDVVAQGLGARGEYVTTPEAFRKALKTAYALAAKEGVSTLINCQSAKEFSNAGDFPPGVPLPVQPGVGAYTH